MPDNAAAEGYVWEPDAVGDDPFQDFLGGVKPHDCKCFFF